MKPSPCKQGDSCWEGYKAQGKKKSPSGKKTSGGSIKMVNNCVPITKKASGSPLKIAPILGMIAKKMKEHLDLKEKGFNHDSRRK